MLLHSVSQCEIRCLLQSDKKTFLTVLLLPEVPCIVKGTGDLGSDTNLHTSALLATAPICIAVCVIVVINKLVMFECFFCLFFYCWAYL